MTTIAEMNRRVQSLDVSGEAVKIIRNTSQELIEYNQQQLFNKGENKLGVKLAAYKNPLYSKFKHALNIAPGEGTPDLKLTGAFYSEFYVTTTKNSFTIGSHDEKEGRLEGHYGKDIFGLNKDNLKDYSLNVFYPYLKEYITKTTGLKFK